jgi:hypothetical protein
VEVVALLTQGHTAAAQCGLFTHKSVPVIFEPPCILIVYSINLQTGSSDPNMDGESILMSQELPKYWSELNGLSRGCTISFFKIWESIQNLRRQNGDMK